MLRLVFFHMTIPTSLTCVGNATLVALSYVNKLISTIITYLSVVFHYDCKISAIVRPFLPEGKGFVSNMSRYYWHFRRHYAHSLGRTTSEDQHKEGEGRV